MDDRHVDARATPGRRVQPENEFTPFDKAEIEQSIPDRFAAQVRRHAGRFAVRTRSEALTYAQLGAAVDRVAAAILAARGHGEEPIGLLFETGAALVVALLAALKAGKICVPLDPAVPPARARTVLEHAQARLVLTDPRSRVRARELTGAICPLLDIETISPCPVGLDLTIPASADSLASIVYTSGSTGQPKGVVHSHRTILHQVMVYTNEQHIAVDDRLAFVASPGGIFTTWFTLTAVLNGASLFPLDLQGERAAELVHWVGQEGVTVLAGGQAIVRGLGDTPGWEGPGYPKLRLVNFGGEAIYRRDVEMCRRLFPGAIVRVGLGTTETGALTSYFLDKDTPITGHVVPVGYPAEDKDVLVLGEDDRDVGVDAVGEIAVRSRYLSPGYWRHPELTRAAFQPNPAGSDCRLYKTGDLGSRRPDGCLVHLGRKDFQLKIRGYRVEIAEIEGALLSMPGVREAVVVAREDSGGGQRLVAYVVPGTQPPPTVSGLRKAVANALPDSMVPSVFVIQDELPLTPTGKVDRLALPAPSRTRPDLDAKFVAPRTRVEATLCAIWGEVLGLDQVGIHDHFLELGGNSLAASRVITRILESIGVDLPLRTLFEVPTVVDMAAVIEQRLECSPEREERGRILAALEQLSEEEAQRLLARGMQQGGGESHE